MPFEHRQFLMRLQRLRYLTGKDPATDDQRQSEVRDIGETIGAVLGQIPGLLAELGNNCTENGKLVNLRLCLSGLELGIIPFEAAVSPDGFPGSGSPLLLQMRTPITITREIRRGCQLAVNWNREPRILFAFAEPETFYVPAKEHLQALREAIEPWIKIKDSAEERLPEIKKMLTVLPNASLEMIRQACASGEYTHVHILAHGAHFKNAGDERYGVALCSEVNQTADIVDGERLAIALTARDTGDMTRARPTVVTLATCDSGNIDSVITPGGSIAHELNAAGIPWVIASQFPLWMKASAIAAKVIYHGLLDGYDPRWVLYELRQRLRMGCSETHDWASIVAYSTVSSDFEQQVNAFRDKQALRKSEVKFDRIDDLVCAQNVVKTSINPEVNSELESLCDSIRADLKKWREEPDVSASPQKKAERFGISAASEKRIGITYFETDKAKSDEAFKASRDFYHEAWQADPCNHWVLTQYLSMVATISDPITADLSAEFVAACQIAKWQSLNQTGEERVAALSTLAELALLGSIYEGIEKFDYEQAKNEIKRCCKEMRDLSDSNAFLICSTRRQFKRYLNYWGRAKWNGLAEEALKALG
ncbi:MAG: CHAT domain-containing protein [Methylobacter sp.]